MAYAAGLGPVGGDTVGVQIPPPAPFVAFPDTSALRGESHAYFLGVRGAVKSSSSAGAESGSARTSTSSPACKVVSPLVVSRLPSLITRLTHTSSPDGSSPIVLPSAGEPVATW